MKKESRYTMTLGELCEITTGKLNANAMVKDGKYPFFTCSDSVYQIDDYAFDCEALLIAGNGYIGNVKYYNGKFNAYQRTYVLFGFKPGVIQYVYLYIKAKFREYALNNTKEGSVPYITLPVISNYPIVFPSSSIEQQRIVDILDKFEGMVENVEKELFLRQKQYEFYREKMIKKASILGEIKSLGEIGTFVRGNGLQKSDFAEQGKPCIHYGQIHTTYGLSADKTISFCKEELWKKLKHAQKGDLLIASTSEDVEACCKATVWMGNEEVAYSGDSICFSHNQNSLYVAHLFKTISFMEQKKPAATGAKVIRVSGDAMSKFRFSFPSLSKQQEIVAKLDKFEEMISTLKRELELRKKQYEYYREKLLTFE